MNPTVQCSGPGSGMETPARQFWLDGTRAFGNATAVTSQEHYLGRVDVVPWPNGTAWVMLPMDRLAAENEEHRKRGLPEIAPLGKWDERLRVYLYLGKREARRVLTMMVGEQLTVVRKGWGREWTHTIRRV